MGVVRRVIREHVLGLTGVGSGGPARARPRPGDGLFGPRSVVRRVHSDFTSMMIGGVAALLVQMLHPAVLAGVWDHTDFRRDMAGRLRRTARFVSGTTYGSTDEALALIEKVRRAHERVVGSLPDGEPYSAGDPELLAWVHAAEVACFLRSHLRYRDPFLPAADQDRYVAEMAVIAEKLGAGRVPTSRSELDRYLAGMRPRLRADARTRAVADALLARPAGSLAFAPMHDVMLRAGVELTPAWAARMHGLRVSPLRAPAIRVGALGVGSVVRWAMSEPRRRLAG